MKEWRGCKSWPVKREFSLNSHQAQGSWPHSNHWETASHGQWSTSRESLQGPVCFAFFPQWNRTINKLWLQYEPKFQQKQYYLWIWIEGHKLSKHSSTLRTLAIWKVLLLFWNSFLSSVFHHFLLVFFSPQQCMEGNKVLEYSLVLRLLLIFLNIYFSVTVPADYD